MFAYLVAGLVVGLLQRYLRHLPGDPTLGIQLAVGLIAGGLGGLVLNVLRDEDFMAVNAWGFAAAAIAAAVALVSVQAWGRRSGADENIDA
jgi:uncharacterized membrane protein YeaQ/YmgE (transglycosylase-associated protein family)